MDGYLFGSHRGHAVDGYAWTSNQILPPSGDCWLRGDGEPILSYPPLR